MHSIHGDIHTEGLADNCEDCARFAQKPGELDSIAFMHLANRNYNYRFGSTLLIKNENAPRSHTEEVAMANLTTQMEQMGRMLELAPGTMLQYLENRWDIRLEVV